MEYTKSFSQNGDVVTIEFTDNTSFYDMGQYFKSKQFSVLKKETIYDKMKNGESVDLSNQYIEGFSIPEYKRGFSPAKAELILKSARESFFENADFSDVSFCGDCIDFSHAIFGKGESIFWKANFFGQKVSFLGAQFSDGRVLFNRTTFNGFVDFSYSKFSNGGVFFKRAEFGNGDVNFDFTIFGEGNNDFSLIHFGKGELSFRSARFGKGEVHFDCTKFEEGDIDFSGAKFDSRYVSFYDSELRNGDANFSRIIVNGGEFNLNKARFGKGQVHFSNIKITSDWHMNSMKAGSINLSDSIIHGTIDFQGSKFSQLLLTNTKLVGKIFIGKTELKFSNDFDDENDVINSQIESNDREKAYQFTLLKENFRNLGQYDDEDIAYFQFKRNQLKASRSNYSKLKYYFIKFFLERMGRYGTDPWTISKFMAITVIIFTYINFFSLILEIPLIKRSGKLIKFSDSMTDSFYHSIVTFLTIGYGDVQPANIIGIFLSGIEGFVGLFLMSYFTVAFVRKVLR